MLIGKIFELLHSEANYRQHWQASYANRREELPLVEDVVWLHLWLCFLGAFCIQICADTGPTYTHPVTQVALSVLLFPLTEESPDVRILCLRKVIAALLHGIEGEEDVAAVLIQVLVM